MSNAAIYIPARGFFCVINLLYPTLLASKCPWGVRLICLAILLQSGWYIITMFGMIKKKFKEYKEMRDKNIRYNWFSVAEGVEKLSFYKEERKENIF